MILTSTLSAEALPGLAGALAAQGWQLRARPLLRFLPPADWAPVDTALQAAARYAAIALTSPRAAEALHRRAAGLGLGPSDLPALWAVGPSTAAAIGWPALTPGTPGGGEVLATAMLRAGVRGPVLHLTGEERRPEFREVLRGHGINVVEVCAYRVALAAPVPLVAALRDTDAVLIGSHRVLRAAGRVLPPPARPPLVVLGPRTAETAMAMGWMPMATAVFPTAPGIVAALGDPTPGPAVSYGATLT